jgi:pilus assembly protein CpaE
MLRAMRCGVRQFLAAPFETGTLHDVLEHCEDMKAASSKSTSRLGAVYAFLPAKAGVGASTIAVNVNLALTRHKEARSLLIDLDVTAGMVGLMLGLRGQHSVIEALENATDLDESIWTKIVYRVGSLDVLPVTRYCYDREIGAAQVTAIIEFARRRYKTVSIDLSGSMELHTWEALIAATRVYLVTTSELPSLYLAKHKVDLLSSLGVGDRIGVVVNRCPKEPTGVTGFVEKALGLTVDTTIPNDYCAVQRMLLEKKEIGRTSRLGKKFDALSGAMFPKSKSKQKTASLFGWLIPNTQSDKGRLLSPL